MLAIAAVVGAPYARHVKQRLTLVLDRATHERIVELAKERGQTVSVVARWALRRYLSVLAPSEETWIVKQTP